MSENYDPKDYKREMAIFALEKVEGKLKAHKNDKNNSIDLKKIRTLSRKMPTLIRFNGLAPTFAFLFDKGKGNPKNEHQYMINTAKDWLQSHSIHGLNLNIASETEHFYESICKLKSQEYRMVTNELIELFGWMKRFSNAMYGD